MGEGQSEGVHLGGQVETEAYGVSGGTARQPATAPTPLLQLLLPRVTAVGGRGTVQSVCFPPAYRSLLTPPPPPLPGSVSSPERRW